MKKHPTKKLVTASPAAYTGLIGGIGELLETARHATARAVNSLMTATYWEVGRRIVEFEQGGKKRAGYGEELLDMLSKDLTKRFGRGFGLDNLEKMRRFSLAFPLTAISATVSRKSSPGIGPTASGQSATQPILSTVPIELAVLPIVRIPSAKSATASRILTLGDVAKAFPLPWSHYVRLLSARSLEARAFYHTEALRGGWSVRQLDRQINSLFYERTALSKNKTAMLRKGAKPQTGDALTSQEAIRDPLVLEFLNLRDEYSETELEDALIHHLESFLLELGSDFAFVGRQRLRHQAHRQDNISRQDQLAFEVRVASGFPVKRY